MTKEFNLSSKMSKDKEDLRDGAYVLTQKDVKEFIKQLKLINSGVSDYVEFAEEIDKLAGEELI